MILDPTASYHAIGPWNQIINQDIVLDFTCCVEHQDLIFLIIWRRRVISPCQINILRDVRGLHGALRMMKFCRNIVQHLVESVEHQDLNSRMGWGTLVMLSIHIYISHDAMRANVGPCNQVITQDSSG